ncbi:hypothetical protein EHO60_02685 [Leptospira fletcheri]|uniref:Uncharacterized protein n=1 Tax=Leptospira fletcheri TaxID=2484981 RepID=A0A4R9GJH3_9LEPT|nr:hypothetical protein [Leptospira fletcheri]TGK13124.1 hypothetical protein EHO60_02685 [Leptospira fletcheri]
MLRLLVLILVSASPLFPCDFLSRWIPRAPDPTESARIESLRAFIRSLEPKQLVVDRDFYRKTSRFEERFGFPFSGQKLDSWFGDRIRFFKIGRTDPYLAYYNGEAIVLGKGFFLLSKIEQALVLVHEARHADGKKYSHVDCPSDFPYLSLRIPETKPAGLKACDDISDGSYGFGAAFLFEVFAYGLAERTEEKYILGLYNSELTRILLPKGDR